MLPLFAEEKLALRPLPAERFRYFKQGVRTVDDSGLVQVQRSYYAAAPAAPHTEITVRVYEHDIEILDRMGTLLRRHPRATHAGHFELQAADRLFNPSRETARLLGKVAKLGPHSTQLAHEILPAWAAPDSKQSTAWPTCRGITRAPTLSTPAPKY